MGLAYYTGSYYLWIAIELIFGIVYSFILNWKINHVYPWLKANLKQGRSLLKKYPEVVQYSKQLFIHKVCGVVQWQTVPFLTYVFANLQTVALYGNYVIITDKLSQFFNAFMESTGAGIGNLIAEGNKDKIKRVFWELLSFRYFMGAGISFCVYMLIEPFISLWLGAQFLLDKTVLFLIVVNIFISFTRGGVMQFLYGYGLYRDIWAPIAEIIINLSIACVCGYLWGLSGVLMGGIVSQILIINIWKPFFLYRSGFKDAFWEYVLRLGLIYILVVTPMPVTGLLCVFSHVFDPFASFISWCGYAGMVFCGYYLIVFTLMMIFMPPFRHFTLRFISNKII